MVKILFEEVSFKASFEGREGRGDGERKEEKSRFGQQRSKSKRYDHHAVFF